MNRFIHPSHQWLPGDLAQHLAGQTCGGKPSGNYGQNIHEGLVSSFPVRLASINSCGIDSTALFDTLLSCLIEWGTGSGPSYRFVASKAARVPRMRLVLLDFLNWLFIARSATGTGT